MRRPSNSNNALRHPLDELLGSQGNIRLLRLLANETGGPLGVTDAAKKTGLTAPGARKALDRLVETGFVVRVGGGRAQQYALKGDEPLLHAVRDLYGAEEMRHESLIRGLRDAFDGVQEVRAAWIESRPLEGAMRLRCS